MNLQTHYDKLMIRKDIEICSLEFDNWPEPSEANYAETQVNTSDNTPHHLLVLPRPLLSNQFYYR